MYSTNKSVGWNHIPLMPHICVSESGQPWFRLWFVAYSVPSHYLNQCWVIVNWTFRNKLHWNFYQNTIFHSRKCIWTYRLRNGGHFVQGIWVNAMLVELAYTFALQYTVCWPATTAHCRRHVIQTIIPITGAANGLSTSRHPWYYHLFIIMSALYQCMVPLGRNICWHLDFRIG